MNIIPTLALQLLLMLHTAINGFRQGEGSKTCGAEMTTSNRICNELPQAFQASITTNEVNLYNLRRIFYPSSKLPPTLLNVSYELKIETDVQVPCFADSHNTITVNSSEVWYTNYGWTSNTIFTEFHPATVNRMQPHLLYLMMAALEPSTSGMTEIALLWDGDTEFLTLHLFLHVKQLSCLPTYKQIDQALQDLTSVLQVYAREQKNLTEWESQDCHVLDGRVFARDWQKYECEIYSDLMSCHIHLLSNIFALALTPILIIIILAVIKGPKKPNALAAAEKGEVTATDAHHMKNLAEGENITLLSQTDEAKGHATYDFFHSLMWTAGGIFLVWSLLFLAFDFSAVCRWRLVGEGIFLFLQFIVVIIFSVSSHRLLNHRKSETLQPIPMLKPSRAIFTAMCCGLPLEYIFCVCYRSSFKCLKRHAIESKIDGLLGKLQNNTYAKLIAGIFPLVSLFLIAGFLSRSLVPVIVYFLVYQRRVLTFYTYVTIVFVFEIVVVTEFDYRRRCKKRERIHIRKKEEEIKMRKEHENSTYKDEKKQGFDEPDFPSIITIARDVNQEMKKIAQDVNQEMKKIVREVNREAHYCCHKSFHWLEHHYPLFTPLFALVFLIIVTMLFVLIYHTIVAQDHSENPLFNLFRALIPAVLVSVYSGWIGVRLKRYFKLEEEKLKPEN